MRRNTNRKEREKMEKQELETIMNKRDRRDQILKELMNNLRKSNLLKSIDKTSSELIKPKEAGEDTNETIFA